MRFGENVAIAGTFGESTGGGLHVIGEPPRRIDGLSTIGIAVGPDLVARSLRGDADQPQGELLIYDRTGVLRYLRVPGLIDGHGMAWDGENVVAVASGRNAVLWIDPGGRVVRERTFPGEGDAWHLNCLMHDGDRLCVCAFGQRERHREWQAHLDDPEGVIADLETGSLTATGLRCPHHAHRAGEDLLVCESRHGDLVCRGPDGSEQRRLHLGGWTRGLAVTDDAILVGVSAQRIGGGDDDRASVVVLDRETWELRARIALPDQEIFDVALVSPELLAGLERGFDTNPLRSAEIGQRALFTAAGVEPVRLWPTGDPLPPEACRAALQAELPSSLPADGAVTVEVRVQNRGPAYFTSLLPHPVQLAARWTDAGNGATHENGHERVARALPPEGEATVAYPLRAPGQPGRWRLALTLVQEHVAWFEDLDPASALVAEVDVT
ncbi:MAG TPA: DUF4915 domain-containing protein [Thermoleophilaceae bacterium]|nr:DUF4915 domain-containing protein [Thermoleophilaceae bacterium]